MSDTNDLNLDELVEAARRLGVDTPERVVDWLWSMIVENVNYLKYRQQTKRTGSHNQTVARNNVALAMAIKLLKEHIDEHQP